MKRCLIEFFDPHETYTVWYWAWTVRETEDYHLVWHWFHHPIPMRISKTSIDYKVVEL